MTQVANANKITHSTISNHAYRIGVIARGMKTQDVISQHYRHYAAPVLRRLAAEVISGDYCKQPA